MKIQFTLSVKEMNAITKITNLFTDKLGMPRANVFTNGDFSVINNTPSGVFTREAKEEDILDICEIYESLSDKIVEVINAVKSLFFLFRDLNEDFAKKLTDIKKRRENA